MTGVGGGRSVSAGPGSLGSTVTLTLTDFGTCGVIKDLVRLPTPKLSPFGNSLSNSRADELCMTLS